MSELETILYDVAGAVATITLNRPDSLNTIVPPMPEEVEAAVERAVADDAVEVIVVRGAGRAFCAGYDFGGSRPRLAAADAARCSPVADGRA
jgi:enoyl-CoA hydratase